MDELDLLKKDWNRQPETKNLSVKEIYPMLLKKSSSIVKTLLFISIAELSFWILISLLPFFFSDSYRQSLDKVYSNPYVFTVLNIFSFAIILVFIYLLYTSYKSISVTDSAKKLMEDIIRTRRIVKYYVIYNLIMAAISLIISFYYVVHNDPKTIESINMLGENGLLVYCAIVTVFSMIFIFIFWLIYRLIYGFLLKRLNHNYKELKKLEY